MESENLFINEKYIDVLNSIENIKINPQLKKKLIDFVKLAMEQNKVDGLNELLEFRVLTIEIISETNELFKRYCFNHDATHIDTIEELVSFCEGIFIGTMKIADPIRVFSQNLITQQYIEKLDTYRNRKNKQWRDKLYDLAYREWTENKNTDKTKALKTAFENFPNKEIYREDFDKHFKSILDKFYKFRPS